jgi:CheY-like chemotaxis protein
MKISTKFIGVSLVLVGAIAVLSGGSTLWRNQTEKTKLEQYTQAKRRIELATQAQYQIQREIDRSKDHVLLQNFNQLEEQPEDSGLLKLLDELETLVPSPELSYIRQRHQIFEAMEKQSLQLANRQSPTALADNQQDFRAINSFGRDINFFLNKLVEQSHQQAQQADRELESVREIANQKAIGYQGERRKILVIDDYEENRLVAINMLEPLGFKLAEADNGQGGFDMAQQICPDLIITDVHMSVIDGLEMTRRLRQLPNFATTPIIASPATLSQVDMQSSLDAGCNSFFPKPIELNGLLAEIQRLLKLQWIYETESEPTQVVATTNNEIDLVMPSPKELTALYAAAQGGFITDMQQEANRIKQLSPEYVAFANRVLELSQQFDDEGIVKLLAPWV